MVPQHVSMCLGVTVCLCVSLCVSVCQVSLSVSAINVCLFKYNAFVLRILLVPVLVLYNNSDAFPKVELVYTALVYLQSWGRVSQWIGWCKVIFIFISNPATVIFDFRLCSGYRLGFDNSFLLNYCSAWSSPKLRLQTRGKH